MHMMSYKAEAPAWRHNSNDVILQHKQQSWHIYCYYFSFLFPCCDAAFSFLLPFPCIYPWPICCHGNQI